jgi:plastocyanin
MKAIVAALAVGLIVLASPAGGAAVRIKAAPENTWDPKTKRVAAGTTIVWKNPTEQMHDLRIWKSPIGRRIVDNELMPDEAAKKRLRTKGVYHYRCRIHSVMDVQDGRKVCVGMCGKIRVVKNS